MWNKQPIFWCDTETCTLVSSHDKAWTNTFVKIIGGENQCVTREWMVNHENWVPHSMNYEEYSVQYAEEAQTLNDLATNVWNTYCVFVRQGRRWLSM